MSTLLAEGCRKCALLNAQSWQKSKTIRSEWRRALLQEAELPATKTAAGGGGSLGAPSTAAGGALTQRRRPHPLPSESTTRLNSRSLESVFGGRSAPR